MYTGLILAAFIGLGVAWLFTRIRRRMGMPVNGKHWAAVVVVFVVLVVLAYGASHTQH
jgi:predicted PurR-regulated permease PerM